ncbi:MAG: cardiolipin synthase [Gammaproteobacteria bacterium]|nr:cardiolipin synthase [Gammaproteobacteria bacterium]
MAALETTLAFLVLLVIDILIAIHILMTKNEEPTSAVLWFFIVFSFPIFGVILYLFFGINRIKTLGLKIELANERIDHAQHEQVSKIIKQIFSEREQYIYHNKKEDNDPLSHHKTLDRLLPKTQALIGNKLELLRNGTTAYPKMLQAIKNAKETIHLQSFIIHGDIIGKEILDALVKKANDGVKVKILYDKFGSLKSIFSHFFAKYKKENPNFQLHPFAFINLFTPWRVQLRNHRKLLVVDGNIAFIGGINISSDNDIRVCNKDKYIHDLHCILHGPAVSSLQMSFLRDWHYTTGAPISQLFTEQHFPKLTPQGDTIVRAVDSGPGQNYAATEKALMSAIVTAKKSLWIMTPYFTPDKAFIKALTMASARGIDIRVIVPKNNNHWYAQFASRSIYRNLLLNRITILEKTGIFSHAKAMLIDNKWAIMGSSNCDIRSFRLNYELDFVATDGDFINELRKQFEHELAQSEEIKIKSVLKKKLPRQLLENLCSLLTPVL